MKNEGPVFFEKKSDFRKWLQKNHKKETELLVGFYKVGSGKASMTWPESVDEALCFGWIDGIRKNVDEISYAIRFTPRKKRSIWSNVNTKRINELIKEGRVHENGLAAFRERSEDKAGIYSFEQNTHKLSPAFEKKFKSNLKAWNFFITKAPWYQRTSIHWVMSAKQEATRIKRLETLINDSEHERTLPQLTRSKK